MRLFLFLLPETAARWGVEIREMCSKSEVRFTDMLLTPDYFRSLSPLCKICNDSVFCGCFGACTQKQKNPKKTKEVI